MFCPDYYNAYVQVLRDGEVRVHHITFNADLTITDNRYKLNDGVFNQDFMVSSAFYYSRHSNTDPTTFLLFGYTKGFQLGSPWQDPNVFTFE